MGDCFAFFPHHYLKKFLRIMRLSFFLSLLTLVSFAADSYAQNKMLTIIAKDATVEDVLQNVEAQSDFYFMYSPKFVDVDRHVSLDVKEESVFTVLDNLFSETNTEYTVADRIIVLSTPETMEAILQQLSVSGVVTDENGEPLPGVSISVEGSTIGTFSDVDGKYTLQNVPPNSTLSFSFIGMASQSIDISGRSIINVVLTSEAIDLDEVIVIGYGTAKRSDLTGAVARADMNALEKSPNVSVLSGLKGVVPGLNIGITTSAGSSPSISIRGQNSISGSTDPLIVLDGIIFRGSIVDINPSDIESIDVLKDASSTAIYGSQAANGVLMITTKTVKGVSKPILEYTSSFSRQALINKDLKRLTKDEFLNQLADIYLSDSRQGENLLEMNPSFNPASFLRDERAIAGYSAGVDTDWWDLLVEPSPYIQNHNLSIRGKTELNSYFVSFGYTDQKNMVINDTYQRYNMRVNLDSNITSWLKIGTSSYFNISDYSGTEASFSQLFSIPSIVSPYSSDGETLETLVYLGAVNPLLSVSNPNKDVRYNLSGNVYADITVPWVKGLSYRITYANNLTTTKYFNFNPYSNSLLGEAQKNNTSQNAWTLDNVVTYKTDFGKHSINATFVYGVEKRVYESTSATANYFTDMSLGFNNISVGQSDQNEISSSAWAESSLYNMLRLVYTYNDRYIFTGTVRRDGFSGFGSNNKFGIFPSAAFAWRASEEHFIKDNAQWLNNLKLRLSYGSSGNRTSGRYATLAQMQSTSNYTGASGYVYGDGGTAELLQVVKSMPNADLKWETTNSVNIGLDFGLFKGRLSGSYEYYISNTLDLLYNINIPYMNGMVNNSVTTNIGKMRNKGHELSITGIAVTKKDFEWSVTANFSTNKNEVVSILGLDDDGDGKEDDLVSSNIFIGEPLNTIYNYNIIGMWQLSDYYDGTIPSGFSYGTYKIEDINGDGVYNAANDRKIIGYSDPLFRLSVQNSLSYKSFDLNIFINSIQGGKDHYLGQPASSLPIPDHLTNNSYLKFDYWTPENTDARYRQLGYYTSSLGTGFSPYVSRSFIRLQEISLAYNFPAALLKKAKINRARIYVSGTNLFTITGWDGWDPEAGIGLSYSSYPTMKSYTIGLSLEF